MRIIDGVKLSEHPESGVLKVIQGKHYKNPKHIPGYVQDKKKPFLYWPETEERGVSVPDKEESRDSEATKEDTLSPDLFSVEKNQDKIAEESSF